MIVDSFEETESSSKKITCESCGNTFSCGANAGKCWCFDVEVKSETLATLREDFNSCLCQNCLEQKNETINANQE